MEGEFIAALIFILILVLLFGASGRRQRFFRPRYRTDNRLFRLDGQQGRDLSDVGQQMHAVMAGAFRKQRVLTPSEYRLFQVIEDEVSALRAGYRVFAQTSLGEVIASDDRDAFISINSKRVDILVIDSGGYPCLAVEFQGDGHYQGTAAARDAVKKEALRKAGVRYLEFGTDDTTDQIRSRVREFFAQGRVAAK